MREFVRSFAERIVWIDDGDSRTRFLVRQPSVGEALQVLTALAGMFNSEGDEEVSQKEREYLFDILREWVPESLFEIWSGDDYPDDRMVASVFALVNYGVPDFKAHRDRMNLIYGVSDDSEEETVKIKSAAEELEATASLPWETYVSDYMHAYSLSVQQVLAEPWNTFLYMSMQIDRHEAKRQISVLQAQSLPWIKEDRDRKKEINRLLARAGGEIKSDEQRRQELLESQQEQLKKLEEQFAKFQPNLRGGDGRNEIRD